MNTESLARAFDSFTAASQSLEIQYVRLQERIVFLTSELARKNEELNAALGDAEENKNYLRAVLFSLEESIVAMDQEGIITMANKSAEDLFGLGGDLVGRRFDELPCVFTNEGSDLVLTVNGRKRIVILSQSPVVDIKGRQRGMVVLVKDITWVRGLEMHHERNQRLIAMGEMAAKIVHEVRNPLCSMELYAGILAKEVGDTGHRELAQGISTGISNLNNILTNMLYFAKPQKTLLRQVRLDRIIEDVISLFAPFIESRDVSLHCALRESRVLGDDELLKQVLMNIIINAVHSVQAGGSITLSIRGNKDYEVVDIRDSGEGIEQENIERIFDPFFSTKEKGTGLGLTIASKIMISHGGFIKVTSEAGKGSTFSLHFPAEEKVHE